MTNTEVAEMNEAGAQWKLKQHLAKPGRYYGNGGTLHSTGEVNVELDGDGHVVSVWFRCQLLPFTQRIVHDGRRDAMNYAYQNGVGSLSGVEIID